MLVRLEIFIIGHNCSMIVVYEVVTFSVLKRFLEIGFFDVHFEDTSNTDSSSQYISHI